MSLTLASRRTGTTTELAVSGEWDLAARTAVRDTIIATVAHGPGCVVLDLSELTFMDSSGVHGVCELNDRCGERNIQLVIVPGNRPVQRLFEICGVFWLLPFLGAWA